MSSVEPVGKQDSQFHLEKMKGSDKSFKEIFKPILDDVSKLQETSDNIYLDYLKGDATIDEVTIAFRKSQVAFELLLQVRNRLMDAYNELMTLRV